MKFKLDEKLGSRTQELFHSAGHDVLTVYDQGLGGASDASIFKFCRQEQRCLVTLDLDFSAITRFPPDKSSGMVVLRIPRNPSLMLILQLISQVLQACAQRSLGGKLWIVEVDRIREHQSEEEFGNE